MSNRPAPFLRAEAESFAAIAAVTVAAFSTAPLAALVLITLLVHLSGLRFIGSGTRLPTFALPCTAHARPAGTS